MNARKIFLIKLSIGELYEIDNSPDRHMSLVRYVWANRNHIYTGDWEMHFIELLGDVSISLFPAIAQAIRIALALLSQQQHAPSNVLSALRRVKN